MVRSGAVSRSSESTVKSASLPGSNIGLARELRVIDGDHPQEIRTRRDPLVLAVGAVWTVASYRSSNGGGGRGAELSKAAGQMPRRCRQARASDQKSEA